MATYAVRLVRGRNWDDDRTIREQIGWNAHAAFMDRLVAEGFVVLGGPQEQIGRVLLLVDSTDEATIRARLAEDPWVVAGMLEVVTVDAWSLWLGTREGGSRKYDT